MKYSRKKLKEIWKKAPECDCDRNDCHPNSHRLCSLCKKKYYYLEHIHNKELVIILEM